MVDFIDAVRVVISVLIFGFIVYLFRLGIRGNEFGTGVIVLLFFYCIYITVNEWGDKKLVKIPNQHYKSITIDAELISDIGKTRESFNRVSVIKKELLNLLKRKKGFVQFYVGEYMIQFGIINSKLLFSLPAEGLTRSICTEFEKLVNEDIKIKIGEVYNYEAIIEDVEDAAKLTDLIFQRIFQQPLDYKITNIDRE